MKIRNGFVSNSSSSSFVIYKKDITDNQATILRNIFNILEEEDADDIYIDYLRDWDMIETKKDFRFSTWMNNYYLDEAVVNVLGFNQETIKNLWVD